MRIVVDEMPKEEHLCKFSIFYGKEEKYYCTKDRKVCDLFEKKCRHYKEENKPIEDDFK